MQINTIDFSALGTASTQAKLREACAQSGCFALANHGISPDLAAAYHAQSARFFQQATAIKRQFERTESNPFGFYDRELTKNRPDWKEVFDISLAPDTPTRWPDSTAFVETMSAWSNACHGVAMQLLAAVFDSLNLSLDSSFFGPDHTSFLRLNYYPVCPNPGVPDSEGVLGVNHHTDAGALTLLQQDGVPGLQFWIDDAWQTAPADPDVLMVNLGDMLQVWTNDHYRAPLHRVLANSETVRYSAPYFLNPAARCDCVPLTSEPQKYNTVNWGEFRKARADGDYADQGEEIQISHFLRHDSEHGRT